MRRRRALATIALLTLAVLVLSACSSPPASNRGPGTPAASVRSSPSFPPIPSESGSGGSGQAPVAWIGGTLARIGSEQLVVKEAGGSKVTLRRLGQDATAFFRAAGGAWARIEPDDALDQGEQACVETLLSGLNLLALRVFLGADCGPTG
jgi:hypothetical protein